MEFMSQLPLDSSRFALPTRNGVSGSKENTYGNSNRRTYLTRATGLSRINPRIHHHMSVFSGRPSAVLRNSYTQLE
jgi:hypothetical protein